MITPITADTVRFTSHDHKIIPIAINAAAPIARLVRFPTTFCAVSIMLSVLSIGVCCCEKGSGEELGDFPAAVTLRDHQRVLEELSPAVGVGSTNKHRDGCDAV